MTVSSSASRNQYTATAGQTVFAYTFEIVSDDDIVVLKNGVTLTKTADYTVSGVGTDSGGNVTLVVGATAGDILTLYRAMAYERLTDYTNAGDFLAADVNNDFDRLWIATQQVNEEVNRSLKAPVTDPLTIDMTIPAKADRLNKILRFNATTGDPEVITLASGATSAANVSFTQAGTGAVERTVETKLNESVSVKDFGAVGDGVTDDTAAIQAAIDSLPAASSIADPPRYGLGGGLVTLPSGTYKITSPITITHNVTLQGDTQGASVIKASSNIDLIQIKYGTVSLSDYAIIAPAVRDLQLDGGGLAEAGITNRSGGASHPVTYALFEGLQIYGCKVGIHLFGAWNNTFRRIGIRALDYNGAGAEGIIGIIGETVTSGNTYGPSGHQVTAGGGAGGFNNNIFDTVVAVYMKRIGIHVRAISAAHAYSNKFINCNFEQTIKQASPQTYAPYTDTSATPEGGSSTPLIWQGEAIGLHTLGRIAGFSIDNCYFEGINDVSATTGGIGISFDDVGIVFGSGASKTYENIVSNNFFNSNCERTVLLGKCKYTKIQNNAILLNASGSAGYLVATGATDTIFINELLSNIDSASTGVYNWLTPDEGLGVNGPARSNAFITVNTGSTTGIDLYRSGGTANFSAIRFRDGTNANTYGQIGFNVNNVRIEATNTLDLISSSTVRATVKQNGQVNFVPLGAAPSGAAAGDVYYDSSTNKLRCYNGTSWNDLF